MAAQPEVRSMSSQDQLDQLYDAICKQVGSVLGSRRFQGWAQQEQVPSGDLIVFNNSFLHRGQSGSTSKSKQYLCVLLDPSAEPEILQMKTHINMTFKHYPARQLTSFTRRDLRGAIADGMGSLGTIVFSLVGAIGNDEPASVVLPSDTGLTALGYEPDQAEIADVSESAVIVNRLGDIDAVWQAIAHKLSEVQVGDIAKLSVCFEDKFSELREVAARPIDVEDIRADASSILSEIIVGIHDQVEAYDQALASHLQDPDDTDALNEVMRIAYNFADGAKSLISLVVGLSDLKPLLSWLTISAQCELAERFGDLPFSLVGKTKPSLDKYRSLIAGARNRTFHDLFAFGRPFRAPLKSSAFEAASLRLFREYKARSSPALEFNDRELVELLQGFTRAAEQPVPLGFWEKDLAVMQAVEDLATALHRALVLVAPEP
jgi:hypothetical protein